MNETSTSKQSSLKLLRALKGAIIWDDKLLAKVSRILDATYSDIDLYRLASYCGIHKTLDAVRAYELHGADRRHELLSFVELTTPRHLSRQYYEFITSPESEGEVA